MGEKILKIIAYIVICGLIGYFLLHKWGAVLFWGFPDAMMRLYETDPDYYRFINIIQNILLISIPILQIIIMIILFRIMFGKKNKRKEV